MSVATALFFMVGFLTCLNDVIIPHLKAIFELNYAEALLVQFAFFSSYFVFSYPGGRIVERFGYKRAMIAGLITMAAGAGMFVPASYVASFPVFLSALIILAAGMTVVQVAINPYVTVIGPPATASSRLNLAQAFNSVGTFIAPFIGAHLILGGVAQISPAKIHSLSAAGQQIYRETQASSVRMALHRVGADALADRHCAGPDQAQDHHRRLAAHPGLPSRRLRRGAKPARHHLAAPLAALRRARHLHLRRRGGLHRQPAGELHGTPADRAPPRRDRRLLPAGLLGRPDGGPFHRVGDSAASADRVRDRNCGYHRLRAGHDQHAYA